MPGYRDLPDVYTKYSVRIPMMVALEIYFSFYEKHKNDLKNNQSSLFNK